ncbi:MAG: GNVR domain-containing protein [Rickettsiales bacterium]|nr:GNVR domain-containing protein [Rickettsiales bacterium]
MQNNTDTEYEFDALLYAKEFLATLHRKRKLVALCMVTCFMLGVFYITVTAPLYTATTSILIDPRQAAVMPDRLMQMMNFRENLILDSQIEVMHSSKLLEKAAERANIYKDLETSRNGLLHSFRGLLFGNEKAEKLLEKEKLKKATFQEFRDGLVVERVRRTYVLDISYTSHDRKKAQTLADLIADVYLEEELVTQYEASQRINTWLSEGVQKLRGNLNLAEQKIENYKSQKSIVDTSRVDSLTDQQLSELNRNLIIARTDTAHAKARYESLNALLEDDSPDKVIGNLTDNRVLNNLRSQYIDLSQRASKIKRDQGRDHQAYTNLESQLNDIKNLMTDEYTRVVQGHKNEYDIALSKQEKLQEELAAVTDISLSGQRDQIELRELQRGASSIQELYTKLLNNLNEQVQRQSAPFVQGRVISYAALPAYASWPNTPLVLILSIFLGATAGIGLIFLRERLDKYIRKAEELEKATQRTCLGMIPKVELHKDESKTLPLGTKTSHRDKNPSFNSDVFDTMTEMLDQQTGIVSEVMRTIQLAIKFSAPHEKTKAVSFVSAQPGEGKSTTSCFLAKHLATTGAKVALIDCDFRRPSLTKLLFPQAQSGFYELAHAMGGKDKKDFTAQIDAICHETNVANLSFIPAKGLSTPTTNLNLVASGQMDELIARLKPKFDVVLIDLPAIMNIADARAVAHSIDGFIFLAHWGQTNPNMVRKALLRSPEVAEKTVGSLLTQVDSEAVTLYGYYGYTEDVA